jgi:C4-dicarboxylate transporter/malic acid transport protein
MGSAFCSRGAGGPGVGVLRAASSRVSTGKREDVGNAGVTFSRDNRLRMGTPADDRRGAPSLNPAYAVAHIRRSKLELAAGRTGRPSLWHVVREFTPNWFSVTMGTGALALALNQVPIPIPGIYDFAGGLWLLDILLFVLCIVIYAARWILFFDEARRIVRHSVLSMFLAAIPMGLATIINGLLIFGGGKLAVWIAHGLWWLDVIMSVTCGLLVPFLMFTLQEHSIEKMTGVWLLPVVAAEVAAVSGALLVPHLTPAEALTALMLCYALWAFSVPVAMSILVILLLRLAMHKLPDQDMAATGWLALGPIGTGALGLLLLGADAPAVFAPAGLAGVGEAAVGLGIIGGTMLWGYGAWWLLLAVLKTAWYLRRGMPFNLGCWGFTFPLGVYSLATLALARATHVSFFSVVGCVLVASLGVIWVIVAVLTIISACDGHLLIAPLRPRIHD